MRIGDAAAAAGTTPRALRFYEQRGLLPPPARSATGQREYGPTEVALVRAIRALLSLGLTVEDLRSRAHRLPLLTGDEPPPCDSAGDSGPETFGPVVDRRLAALDAEIAHLTALRDNLARARRPSPGPTAADPPPSPSPT
ncbi:MerR family transcriptional regulator [Kitasatospora sp. NPDC059327]|uniref:MerR family transcriptional regulator n=1 Tax=Kitasatospora sp. NPDC059327 TaxID=3346803 RepID=UPI0036BFED65